MTQKEFENLLDGLFDTMNNIYKVYCDTNGIKDRNIELDILYQDKKENAHYNSNCDGTFIPNSPWWDEREV